MTGHFLQSHEWEGFQKSLGREVFRMGEILVTKLPLIAGKSYLYSAGIMDKQNPQTIFAPRKGETSSTPLLHEVNDSPLKSQKLFADFALKENVVFFKFEPMTEDKALVQELIGAGCVKSKKEIQPQRTIVLDLTKSQEELLGKMHPKTRYNIRVAEGKGVNFSRFARSGEARQNSNFQTREEFWELLQKTSQRDKFSSHSKKYYEKLLELHVTQLFTAQYQGKIIAANIVLFYGERATYLYGASDYEYRNLMAPYLLHWETIKYAKERGFKEYDFWGIDEKKWPGLTRFKRGFGGRDAEYIGSYDYVFQSLWYKLYALYGFVKSFSRNLKPKI